MAEKQSVDEDLAKQRLDIERFKVEQETARHTAEMALREQQLKHEAERLDVDRKRARSSRDPLIIGVLAASFGLFANAWVAQINAKKEREITAESAKEERLARQFNAGEQLKQSIRNNQAERILEALKTEGDTDKVIENLRLLAEAGLVTDFEKGISGYVRSLDERRIETQNPKLGPGTTTTSSLNDVASEPWLQSELEYAVIESGSSGQGVTRLQEWLLLNGYSVVISGTVDDQTEVALRRFAEDKGLAYDGELSRELDRALKKPIHNAANPEIDVSDLSIQETIVAIARLHLENNPREVGGANRGPWVRYYMNGNDGSAWPWSAGFVTTILGKAYALHKAQPPIGSFSNDTIANQAKGLGIFLSEKDATADDLSPGDLFLLRRTSTDWVHVGIIIEVGFENFKAIEGNTNNNGSREGYEVAIRSRSYAQMDFIKLPPISE